MLGPVVCDVASTQITPHEAQRIAHPLVGMVILFTRNYEDPQQLTELCAAIHAVKPGLLIAVDHEGGRVQRFRKGFTEIPAMHDYGDLYARDPERGLCAASAAGYVLASELRACGVDLTFAPVLDLDWGRSEIIGARSFSKDPRIVARLAAAVTHGFLTAGMANCGKHFPGHGWALADSHVALPEDERSAEVLETIDAMPYAWLGINLVSIMTAHIVYPQLDSEPATFSPRILQGLLREKLGFKGFVFSDDLSMQGARNAGTYLERAEKALSAGCDGLICCNAPDEVDAMIKELRFTATDAWCERAERLAPIGTAPRREELQKSALYRRAVELMRVA